jgi:UDP-N-acetylglucosamine transferase subunit ALG13
MIFITTGTQEPFDRLLEIMDEIAMELQETEFIVQAFQSNYQVKHMKMLNFINPDEFNELFNEAELIVSHAGMGTIISSLVNEKPIIVMPRLVKYHEHRNEHQLSTAKKFDDLGYINVAYDGEELKTKFFNIWPDKIKPLHKIGNNASSELIQSLRSFIL